MKITNIVIAGLGGQGVIKASDILADAAFRAGFDVKKSELHGMSQRGGSVSSDVRFGAAVLSPMVPPGEADVLVVLEETQIEINRAVLRAGGALIGPDLLPPDALKNRKSLNVALLGAASTRLEIPEAHWLAALRANLPEKLHALNEQSFALGRAAAQASSSDESPARTSHDQNFKNLLLDYPREAIAFFAATEAAELDPSVRILPVRQEQLQERLGERFRELDVPLLLEWPDERRAALLFVLEEETEPRRFSIHRLAHYCLDLAELLSVDRVVPVVIFLHPGAFATTLRLGGDARTYLSFQYLAYPLFQTPASEHYDSPNLVARLNLPNMAYAPDDKVDVYAHAVRGLLTLEHDPERRIKYLDFIDIYAHLDENEQVIYQQRYAREADSMSGFAERFILQGVHQGVQQGVQQGEARVLLRLLASRFGELPAQTRQAVEDADAETLLHWSDRVLTARTLEDVLH